MKDELIGLVDVSTIMHNIRQGTKKAEFFPELLRTLSFIKYNTGCSKLILIGDNGASSFRKGLYPEYKEHRQEIQKKYTQAEIDRLAEMRFWYKELHRLSALYYYADIPNVEADDVISMLFHQLIKEEYSVVVITRDKDYLSSIPQSYIFDWYSGKYFDDEKSFGFTPNKFLIYQTILGDAQDNIMSIGTKSSAGILTKNFNSFPEMRAFDIENILELEGVTPYNKRYVYSTLQQMQTDEGYETLKLSYKLVKIFRDTSCLTDEQKDKYSNIFQDIIGFTPTKIILDDEFEEFLMNNDVFHWIVDLESAS